MNGLHSIMRHDDDFEGYSGRPVFDQEINGKRTSHIPDVDNDVRAC
jgi:hypothetical protein